MVLGRILFDIVLFLLAILLPGWWFFLFGTVASYFFAVFWEFIIISLIVDVLYGFSIAGFYEVNYIFTALSIVVVLVIAALKSKIRVFR
jgi:hypothetical protein